MIIVLNILNDKHLSECNRRLLYLGISIIDLREFEDCDI